MFEHIPAYPGDPILSLNEDFHRDARLGKVNLSIGIYFDAKGLLPVLRVVQHAEQALQGERRCASSYLSPRSSSQRPAIRHGLLAALGIERDHSDVVPVAGLA
jgi:aspartate/tyrosine/aromatic aminotransferase